MSAVRLAVRVRRAQLEEAGEVEEAFPLLFRQPEEFGDVPLADPARVGGGQVERAAFSILA
jgi:hypothetical protein